MTGLKFLKEISMKLHSRQEHPCLFFQQDHLLEVLQKLLSKAQLKNYSTKLI